MAGYHFYITRADVIESPRPPSMPGAHAIGYNHCSPGVCYEGGLRPDGTPWDIHTPEQRAAMLKLLQTLVTIHPEARIVGHRDLSPDLNHNGIIEPHEWMKACPCFGASKEYLSLWHERQNLKVASNSA